MASLREIKDRIGSVKSTLKITSAMKLVSSAKLRKAQRAIEGMRPYEHELMDILRQTGLKLNVESRTQGGAFAVVAVSSNSSLCGAFNANAIRQAMKTVEGHENVRVFSIGRKMAEAMKKAGYESEGDYTDLIAHPSYSKSAALAQRIYEGYVSGEFSKVVFVYNSFVSTSTQVPVEELYLPFSADVEANDAAKDDFYEEYIIEPGKSEVVDELLPLVITLKFHSVLLDSAAAEQAARTMAMQTATDNAQDLLSQLTLEYNKGRQQKITAEILDLMGGAAE